MDEAQRKQRRRRLKRGVMLAPLVLLAGVLALLAAGIAPGRLRPVAAFLGLASLASFTFEATRRLNERHMRRLGAADVPWGVRFDKPFWMEGLEISLPVGFGALVGALLAVVGWPSIGVGVLLTFTAFAGAFPYFGRALSPRGLTFEQGGLRLHGVRLSLLVPWTSITRVECVGPDHMVLIILHLVDPGAIVAAAQPADEKERARLESLVGTATSPTGKLMLWPGIAGLSGETVARAITAARSGRPGQVN